VTCGALGGHQCRVGSDADGERPVHTDKAGVVHEEVNEGKHLEDGGQTHQVGSSFVAFTKLILDKS
jgi:hypothetical protein